MRYVQKLVLVPLEEWEKIKNKSIKEVKEVVVSQALPAKMNTLTQKVQQGAGKEVPKVSNTQKTVIKKTKKLTKLDQMIRSLSPAKRGRAYSLVRYIKKNDDISWNEKGEFQYKKRVIPHSNMSRLIYHAIRNSKSKPTGMKPFYQALSPMNIPKYIIVNKEGRQIMNKVASIKDNSWRPPGKLNKK